MPHIMLTLLIPAVTPKIGNNQYELPLGAACVNIIRHDSSNGWRNAISAKQHAASPISVTAKAPDKPNAANWRNGYQITPQIDAPAIKANAGHYAWRFKNKAAKNFAASCVPYCLTLIFHLYCTLAIFSFLIGGRLTKRKLKYASALKPFIYKAFYA